MKAKPAPDFDDDCAVAVTFARIAALSPPDLPPGIAERIVRDVPRLAQMPAPARLPLRAVASRAAPLVRVVASQQARRPSGARRPIAAWSALAAGLAAVALMLPSAFPARPVLPRSVAPHQIAWAQQAGAQKTGAPIAPVPQALPKTSSIRAHRAPAPALETPDSDAATVASAPVVQPAPLPGVIAVALAVPAGILPARPVYGPVDTEAALSSGTGTIGSGPTTGYAFTGGAAGAHR